MGKIPEKFRGPIASARTGIPSPDRSGEIIAGQVRGLADTFFQGVLALEAKSKKLLDDSTRAKAMGDYTAEYMGGANKIKNQNIDNPEEAQRQLKEFRATLKDKHVDALSDRGIQQEFAFDVDNINVHEGIRDVAWKIHQSSLIAQKNYTDRISNDAFAVSQTPSFEEYVKKVEQFKDEEATDNKISQAFGGLAEGQKVVDSGTESITRGFISGKMERGESLEAATQLMRGDFDAYINPKTKNEMLNKLDKAQRGDVQESAFMQAARSAADNYAVIKGLADDSVGIVGIEENISNVVFQIDGAEANNLSSDELLSLNKQLDVLEKRRDAELQKVALGAVDDNEVKGSLLARYQDIIKYDKKKGRQSIKGALDAVLDFQRDATQAFFEGKLTEDTYNKWTLFTEAAIDADIKKRIREPGVIGKGVFGQEGFVAPGGKLSKTRKVREAMNEILSGIDTAKGKDFAVEVLDFYMDGINDQLGGDMSQLENMSEEVHGNIVENAKRKASLKSKGLPVYTTVGNRIETPIGLREVVDFREGEPIISFSNEDMLELKRIGVVK